MKPQADIDLTCKMPSANCRQRSANLPSTAETPVLSKFDFDDLPVMRLAVFSDQSEMELSNFAADRIQPALAQVPGVAEVRLLGARTREISVQCGPAKTRPPSYIYSSGAAGHPDIQYGSTCRKN
jgi:hydrophobic/amphiphilic exporter-1 (mainly G- bacteria), HAE1 family